MDTKSRLEIAKFGIYIFLPISVMYIVGRPEMHRYMKEHHMQRIPRQLYETRNLPNGIDDCIDNNKKVDI